MQRLSRISNALIGSLLGYGLTSGMLNARTNAHLGAFGGPFSPSQGIELHQQIIMFKCIASKVPIPSDLLLSFGECPISNRSSDIPPNVQTLSDFILSPNSLGAEYNRKGSMNNTDLQKLDRCGRTDGKKWQCSNYALANRKYCEKHVNRGRRPSKKLEEDQTSRASILVPPSTRLPAASTVSGAGLHTSLNQTENLQLNTFRHAQTMHLQDISSKYRILKYENCIVPIPTEPTHSPAKPNLLLQPISPISENNESLSSSMILDNHKKSFIGESSSASSSVFPEYLMLCEGMRQAQNAMTWDPVSSAASMGGPLGGILANNNNTNNIAFSSPSNRNTKQCNFSRVFVNTLPTHPPSHASNHDTDECEFIQAFANTLPPNAAVASNHHTKKCDFTWAFASNRSTEEQNFTLAFADTLPAHASNRNTEGQDSNWPFADTFPPHASDVSNRITEKWDFSWPYANTEERTRAFFDIFPPHTSDASNSKTKEWDFTWPFANTPPRHSFDASNSNIVERTRAFADTLPPLTSDASNRKTERWSWVFADALPPHTSVASNCITEEWNFTSPSWAFADTPLSALTSDASESPTGDFLSTDSETGSD